MKIFICGSCWSDVPSHWVEPSEEQIKRGRKARWEPDSHYWKGEDIEEAYCSAQCSLDKYELVGRG